MLPRRGGMRRRYGIGLVRQRSRAGQWGRGLERRRVRKRGLFEAEEDRNASGEPPVGSRQTPAGATAIRLCACCGTQLRDTRLSF